MHSCIHNTRSNSVLLCFYVQGTGARYDNYSQSENQCFWHSLVRISTLKRDENTSTKRQSTNSASAYITKLNTAWHWHKKNKEFSYEKSSEHPKFHFNQMSEYSDACTYHYLMSCRAPWYILLYTKCQSSIRRYARYTPFQPLPAIQCSPGEVEMTRSTRREFMLLDPPTE